MPRAISCTFAVFLLTLGACQRDGRRDVPAPAPAPNRNVAAAAGSESSGPDPKVQAFLTRHFDPHVEHAPVEIVAASFEHGDENHGDIILRVRNVTDRPLASVGYDIEPPPDCVETMYRAMPIVGVGLKGQESVPPLPPGGEWDVRISRGRYDASVGRRSYGCADGVLPVLSYVDLSGARSDERPH